jgi:uncharacterized protein (DUF1499 family)
MLGVPLLLISCASTVDRGAPDPSGPLKPCPASPNCVSTLASDPDRRMAPLPYRVDRATSRTILLSILAGLPRTTVVARGEHYLRAECRSQVFGFVDDLEFAFDDEAGQIHFRSASRSGYWDFGVNRKRMSAIGDAYRNALLDDVAKGAATP